MDWLYWFIFHVNLHCLPEASATSQVLTKYFTVFGKQCLYVYLSLCFPHLVHFQHLVQPSLTFLHFLFPASCGELENLLKQLEML